MSKEKIESRRAFMKKLGKTAATVAGAAAFIAVAKTVEAAPSEDSPVTQNCAGNCSWSCMGGCLTSCMSSCTAWQANVR